MIQYNLFPGGVRRIVTFSYDDGNPEKDQRLVDIFNKYGVKGTFHLNSKNYINMSEDELCVIRERYKGHEISCHTVRHGWLDRMAPVSVVNEVMEDRKMLEHIAGYPVVGMSYPSGAYNDEAKNILSACGIVYSRTVDKQTHLNELPKDFLAWHPSCHHNGAEQYIEQFMENLDSQWYEPLFYIWGHSHELRTDEDWAMMERIVAKLSGSDKIWYATNIEIYRYMKAQRDLVISADETIIHNPSAIDVWVEKNKKQKILIPAGQTVIVE